MRGDGSRVRIRVFAGTETLGDDSHLQKFGGLRDAFITKLNPAGSALVYSTYLGGHDFDAGQSIAIDAAGNAYVAGLTASVTGDFPLRDAFQSTYGGGIYDMFVCKLNADGSRLIYSSYLGGSGEEYFAVFGGPNIALDSSGNTYVAGITTSTDFPTHGAVRGNFAGGASDGFIAKVH